MSGKSSFPIDAAIHELTEAFPGAKQVPTPFGHEFERRDGKRLQRLHMIVKYRGLKDDEEFYYISAKRVDYLRSQQKYRDDVLVFIFKEDTPHYIKVTDAFDTFKREKQTYGDGVERDYVAIPSGLLCPV